MRRYSSTGESEDLLTHTNDLNNFPELPSAIEVDGTMKPRSDLLIERSVDDTKLQGDKLINNSTSSPQKYPNEIIPQHGTPPPSERKKPQPLSSSSKTKHPEFKSLSDPMLTVSDTTLKQPNLFEDEPYRSPTLYLNTRTKPVMLERNTPSLSSDAEDSDNPKSCE